MRWKRVAGIAAPLWKKFARGLFPLVSSARLLLRFGWAERGWQCQRSSMCPSCVPVGAGHVPSIPPAKHSPLWLEGQGCVWHVCVTACALCAGCSQGALWMFIFYLIYSREGVWCLQKALKMARLLPGLIFLAASVDLPQCLHCFTRYRQVVN